MKVMSILGTRPEIIKMSEIIKKLDKYTNHVFVHTGQNYNPELSEVFYKDLDLRLPDIQLEWDGDTLGEQIGGNFYDMSKVLLDEKPDAVVILGDTNSAIAGTYLAKRMKIPIFHLEAGNRCFDLNVPEEVNRMMVDKLGDVNLVYTENSRRYLLDEGAPKDRVFIMGSPMQEVLAQHKDKIAKSKILEELELKPKEYFVVSIHRDENTEIEKNLVVLLETLKVIAYQYELPIIVSCHPRLRKKIEGHDGDKLIKFMKPFGFFDYIYLQANAKCVISDSGTISEESAILGFPAITIRNAIERPEAVDVGSILMTGVDEDSIMECLEYAIDNPPTTHPLDYAVNNCSERVLKVVLGYTPYVRKYVWHE